MYHSGNELINPFKVLERAGIAAGWHVGDLGCGALGHFVFPAAQLVGGDGRVYAVDIQKIVLQAIERKAKAEQYWNVFPVWSDIEVLHATRIPTKSLHLTIIANNLYLSRNRRGLIQEALRLTRYDGRILIVEWKKERTVIGPDPEHRLSAKEMKDLCQHTDLRLIEEFDAGDHHVALLYKNIGEPLETEVLSASHARF